MIVLIEDQDGFTKALNDAKDKLVVVDFTATWCGPCQRIAPVYKTLSEKYSDVVFLKVDVDDAQDVAGSCGISCMPTFQCYRNGKKVGEVKGADETKLEQLIMENK